MKIKQDILTKALAELVHYMAHELYIEGGETDENGNLLEPERDARTIQLSDVALTINKYMDGLISKKQANKKLWSLMDEFNDNGYERENHVFKRYKTLECLATETQDIKKALEIIKNGGHRI